MNRLYKTILLTLIVFIAGTSNIWAEETAGKPLAEVFDSTVIIPFDYYDKVFLNGQKTDVYEDYKLFQKNGRVLVPIRMMSYLAAGVDRENGYWQVVWDPQKPDDVVLTNFKSGKQVKLKVNSKTMYINNQPHTLDVAPQKIEGRIVLPLRSTSEALDKKITWFDGLIFISNDVIDLQSPKTLEILDKVKEKLTDPRQELNYEKRVSPVAKHGDTVYYIKTQYNQDGLTEALYKKTGSQSEVKIELPGKEKFVNNKIINNELYYISTTNSKSEIHYYNFFGDESRKLCALEQWNPDDGWLGDIVYTNKDFYIILHSGDLTMGSETLYKLENGRLKEIAGAKGFIKFAVAGDYLYYEDFTPMFNAADNLYQVNIQTGEKKNLGEKDFAYGILRTIDDKGTGYSGRSSFYVQDGYIYTLGYQESDEADKCSVYKLSLNNQTQIKLTPPAREFWLVDNSIYYIDLSTGYLARVDLTGNNHQILADQGIIDLKFYNENIYYTAVNNSNANARSGKLYKYNIPGEQTTQLSEQSVSEFFVGKAGIYYKAEDYNLGLYKIDIKGQNLCLVGDSIDTCLYTDAGMVYTLRYIEGVYTTK
ncbi:hypothetical protein SPSYN_01162 [Sporotomaculum syntrophicum]|uniref:DUF5050 domain-containing protein n=1 Tax=Sporotomaculum syntrophicum TaxID=182264 RepID=A0A9D2WQF0_9FIRM|nr:DUF5050 domain-containing protein [Sporotomaculum syntrophicum]KAF1085026.1 hypothetical protein SPSYN_01162 [Sporotomaculum syntrophicum]